MSVQPQSTPQTTVSGFDAKTEREGLRLILTQTNESLNNARGRLETILGLLDERDSPTKSETPSTAPGVMAQMFFARTQAQSIHLLLDELERLI